MTDWQKIKRDQGHFAALDRNAEGAQRMERERAAQLLTLRASSPKRTDPGRTCVDQVGTTDLPLFDAAAQPALL